MNATGSVLVDTSVVVDYLRQDPILHQETIKSKMFIFH